MRFSAVAVAALAAGVSAGTYSNATVSYTTEVVTAYTTYCPEATLITHGAQVYTVTEATTLTITNCPCTLTKPVTSATVTPAAPASAAPVVYSNSSAAAVPVTTTAAVVVAPTTAGSTAAAATFTGAATKAFAASGAGLAGLLGVAAYFL